MNWPKGAAILGAIGLNGTEGAGDMNEVLDNVILRH